MKNIIFIKPLSAFVQKENGKERTEVEYYSDGTNAVVVAFYELK